MKDTADNIKFMIGLITRARNIRTKDPSDLSQIVTSLYESDLITARERNRLLKDH